MFFGTLKGQNDQLNAALETATKHTQQLERQLADKAVLVSVEQNGPALQMVFVREGVLHRFEFYGTRGQEPIMRKLLLE